MEAEVEAPMGFEVCFDREEDGRWIAEIEALPGVAVYGCDQFEARSKVLILAAQVLNDRSKEV